MGYVPVKPPPQAGVAGVAGWGVGVVLGVLAEFFGVLVVPLDALPPEAPVLPADDDAFGDTPPPAVGAAGEDPGKVVPVCDDESLGVVAACCRRDTSISRAVSSSVEVLPCTS